jgi:glycosyl transferase family 25
VPGHPDRAGHHRLQLLRRAAGHICLSVSPDSYKKHYSVHGKKPMNDLHGFIIHLRKATRRTPQVAWIADHLACPVTVVDAVDGSMLSQAERGAYREALHEPRYPFELSPGEQGAFHSHRACWKMIVDGECRAGLILEDDLEFTPAVFDQAVQLAKSCGIEDAYVRFPLRARESAPTVIAKDGDLRLIRPEIVALGAVGQVVGKEAARRLLAATENFDRPVDTFLQMRWVHGVRVLSVWPSSLREVSVNLGGSLIHQKTPGWGAKLAREWKRFWYRRAVNAWSRKASGL